MTADGTYTAVVDRFEDELAVLLLEDDGETVDERVLSKERLPAAGRHVNAILTIDISDEDVVEIDYQEDETQERAERAQNRFDELSQRPPSRDTEWDSS
jgi:hypothetical protein